MNFIFISLFISIFIVYLLFQISKKIPNILEYPSNTVRKIHSNNMINIGGVTFISFYFIFIGVENIQIRLIAVFSMFFLILGLIADLNKAFSANFRLILMILASIFYMMLSSNYITYISDWYYFSGILSLSPIFSIIFTLLCILVATNAFNIIDGQHGLMLGTSIITILCFKANIAHHNPDLELTLNSLLAVTASLFIFNYIGGKIKSGDCGSYFLGFTIAALAIYINNLDYINSFYIACILFYPTFELFFTYVRRIINNKNPFKPDNYHLHSSLFKALRLKFDEKKTSNEIINRATAFLILSTQSIIQILIYFYANSKMYIFIFFSLSLVYLTAYYFVQKLSKAKN